MSGVVGLIADTTTFSVDAINDRVEIGDATAGSRGSAPLQIVGRGTLANAPYIEFTNTSLGYPALSIGAQVAGAGELCFDCYRNPADGLIFSSVTSGNQFILTKSNNSLSFQAMSGTTQGATVGSLSRILDISTSGVRIGSTSLYYQLPLNDRGTTGQVLTTNGAGLTSWSTASGGDVTGPGSATVGDIAMFNNANGKVLADSGVLASTGVVKAGTFTAANRVALAAGANRLLTETSYTVPTTDGTVGYALKMASTGVATWQADSVQGALDVQGPAGTVVSGNLASFNGTTGKIIQDSLILAANVPTMSANGGAGNLIQTSTASRLLSDAGIPVANVATMGATAITGNVMNSNGSKTLVDSGIAALALVTKPTNFSTANRVVVAAGASKVLSETGWTVPTTVGSNGLVLKSDGTNVTFQADTAVIPTCLGSQRVTGNGTTLSCVDMGYITATPSTSISIDMATNHIFDYSITGAASTYTITLSGGVNGRIINIVITTTNAQTLAWAGTTYWPGGTKITTTKAGSTVVFTVLYSGGKYLITGVEDLK